MVEWNLFERGGYLVTKLLFLETYFYLLNCSYNCDRREHPRAVGDSDG